MLKKIFVTPDTFDPDDRRRRQVLNSLLMFFVIVAFLIFTLTLTVMCCSFDSHDPMDKKFLLTLVLSALVVFGVLLAANRSPHVPGWLVGTILMIIIFLIFTQADSPSELYNGRSTILWAVPIILAAIIFRPGYAFLIVVTICGLMEFFTPPDGFGHSQVNYYSMIILAFIASSSWLGMSIANRAIRDARRQASNLQAIFNNVGEGVLVLDLAGNILSANPALLQMIPEDDLRQIVSKPLQKTVRWRRKVFSVSCSPVPEVGIVAVFRDETRHYETERARDALLATVSHELRTPLAAVMNYLEMSLMLVNMKKLDTQAFVEHLTRALENSRRLQHLVNNILDQAQIQAGVLDLKWQVFNLPALFEKSRQLLDSLLKQKKLSFNLSIASNVPVEIMGDPDRLHQVLVNLIGNAIKFTHDGGVRVNVSAASDDMLSIEVRDTGPGIPEEQLPDIFEAFRRGSDYAQREHQGAGLGLSIAKEIVTHMGGEISVSSTLGVGSAFIVSLPLNSS